MTSLRPEPIDMTTVVPSLRRVLSPDEWHQAQTMTPSALAEAKFPAAPPLDFTVKPDASTTQVNAPPVEHQGVIARAFNAITGAAEHPVETAAGIATAPIKGAVTAGQYGLQQMAEHFTPEAYAAYKAQGGVGTGHDVTPKEAVLGAVQALTPLATGPATGFLTKVTGKVVPAALGALAAHTAVGAATGAAYSPDDPAVGALIGGTLGLATGIPAAKAAHIESLLQPVREQVTRVDDALRTILAPETRSPEAMATANIIRARAGAAAREQDRSIYELDRFRRDVDPLPTNDKLGFIDAYEGGESQPTEIFAQLASTAKALLDDRAEKVRALGTGKLETLIENYFPHIWKNADQAREFYRAAMAGVETEGEAAKAGTTRALEGSKAFLKRRLIPTTAEGMAMGLEPVTTNPIDLLQIKLREMDRYLLAHQIAADLKEAGVGVEYVPADAVRPDGLVPLNDKIFTVFGPREGAVTVPEGAVKAIALDMRGKMTSAVPVAPEDISVAGRRIMGQYYAPEPVARVLNNYLSPGLRGNVLYDAYRGLGNALNRAQLGISAFHLTASSVNTYVSQLALGLQKLTQGNIAGGVADILTSPAAPYTSWKRGKAIEQAARYPATAGPDLLEIVQAMQDAGGRIRMDPFYKGTAPWEVANAWRAGEYGKAAGLSIPAFLEWQSKWLMENIVPRQKLGIFGAMARNILDNLPDDVTRAERLAALSKAWDSVDNRMGQMVYDNLFWNKAFKDLAMASVRSVGWNIGTIRELGGGTVDLAKGLKNLATGEQAELTHRAAFVAALPIGVGMLGAMYQYLRTGQGPQELKDYYFPKTGEVDADGNPERVQIASYMKDLYAYAGSPWQTAKHKLSPALSAVVEMFENQDYYGDQIRNPNDPWVKQALQEAKWVGAQTVPFSVQGILEGNKRGDQSATTKLGNLFGITPAPRARVRTEAQNKMAELLSERTIGATPEDALARQTRRDILTALRGDGGDVGAAVSDALTQGQLTPKQLTALLKRAGLTPAQEKFKQLTVPQALEVFKLATPREQALFAEALANKLAQAGQ